MKKNFYKFDEDGNLITGSGAIIPDGFKEFDSSLEFKEAIAKQEAEAKLKQAKLNINKQTQDTIYKILGVDNKDSALVKQANMQAEATSIIYAKAVEGRYPAGGEARLQEIEAVREAIAEAIKKGKELKSKIKI